MWRVWDKTSDIDGFSAEWYLNRFKHLQNEETIFLKTENGTVTQIAGKSILASAYGIDPTLPNDEFIAEYERVIAEPTEEETEA